jgi:ubiquinone/menaquinone biosynthesis C-methylase UbiE
MFKKFFQKTDRRTVFDSIESLIGFKSNAWVSRGAAKAYFKGVEHDFFDNVTSHIFVENLEENSYVLDVGAGTGRLSLLLADNGHRLLSTDISKEMLNFIETRKGTRDIEVLEAAADKLPFENEKFDAVVSMDFLLHFPNWEDLLKEQARLCKKGGVIMFNILSSDNVDFLKNNRKRNDGISNFFVTNYAVFSNEKKIQEVSDNLGLKVEAMLPYNFFTANSMLGCNLTKKQVDDFAVQFNEAIKNQHVMSFVKAFEEKIVRSMPLSCSVTMIVKLRKI